MTLDKELHSEAIHFIFKGFFAHLDSINESLMKIWFVRDQTLSVLHSFFIRNSEIEVQAGCS